MGDIAKMLLQYDAVKVLLLGFFLLFLLILFMIIRITYAPGKALYKGIKGSRKMEFEDFKESYLEDPDMFLLYEDEIWHLDKPVSEMNEEEKGIYDKAAARRSDGGDLIDPEAALFQQYPNPGGDRRLGQLQLPHVGRGEIDTPIVCEIENAVALFILTEIPGVCLRRVLRSK